MQLNKELMYDEYINNNLTLAQISEKYQMSPSEVGRIKRKFGMHKESPSDNVTEEILRQKYEVEGKSCNIIAKEMNVSDKFVSDRLKLFGIKISPRPFRNGLPLYHGYGEISGNTWSSIRGGAKLRKIPFIISVEFAWNLLVNQNFKCAISGVPIILIKKYGHKSESTASLDRIDSNKPYIEGNVQWVHKDINLMKQNLSEEEFSFWVKTVSKYNRR